MLNQVVSPLRTVGNSWSQMIQNLFGYMPGPIIYGVILELSGNPKSRLPMMTVQGISIFCVVFLIIARIIMDAEDRKLAKKYGIPPTDPKFKVLRIQE